ncbi:acetyl-CoA decarbonylase/synthase complex subunit gamma [Dethiobacter alkaliphilus]|uniref:CO dehydrogenase/acetyl-CoA synthase delta subunit, TIM barrel n=1 Tax=Dethiobacter alkaliphilus AHT 1 TaxID=555088 RepID=C0GF46_DETAL|nr:acetyl-CoA decarbonylase/synthase complex subunit gamma [Dethiobacter alkaliphilus]EEG78228.1 CO dehydrogenase/acetyl-CoA synthase delta subunit, TIM barrel [Dethiobacter alkaliphilus AHT 1]
MGLTGLEIFKQLPKTNTGDCGFPTCLAFAMALAAGKTSLDKCPHVSEEAKEALGAAAAPPIKLVKVGTGDHAVEMGDETELFRHDKRFYHPTALAVLIEDTEDVAARVAAFDELEFDRVGLHFVTDMVALQCTSGDGAKFKAAAEAVAAGTQKPFVLICEDVAAMETAATAVADKKPLLYAATNDNYEAMTELAKKLECPLAVKGNGLADLADLVEKITKLGYKELVLDSGNRETSQVLADLTQIRRSAVRKRFRPFGYPAMAFTTKDDPMEEVVQAGVYLSKYAGMIVLKASKKEEILPLVSWRQNLFTDPQKPIQVEAKAVAVGDVTPDSPVYITTNFSLTYYIVEGEVEGSKVPAWIVPVNTDGISVLTAWAAGKLTGDSINKALKENDMESKVNHKTLVLPGYVAVLSGSTEEETGWKVIVGPREAAGIGKFAKDNFGK